MRGRVEELRLERGVMARGEAHTAATKGPVKVQYRGNTARPGNRLGPLTAASTPRPDRSVKTTNDNLSRINIVVPFNGTSQSNMTV